MLKLGIIGTNWITAQFVEAARLSGAYELTAVYSRRLETAEKFIEKVNGGKPYTDLDEMLAEDVDVVYIASPNSLHVKQAIAVINAGKHAIVEKPLVTHPSQLDGLQKALAAHPEALLFEAARHLYDPNFAVITDWIKRGSVSGATLTYAKYSSRYDAYLAGENPNIFSPRFGGGALMDLGVYLVYAAVAWFGEPLAAQYLPRMLASGVDGSGVARLSYADFDVILMPGKFQNSYLGSEITRGRETLRFESPGELNGLELIDGKGNTQSLQVPHADNPMLEEATYFARAFETNDREASRAAFALAERVHNVMGELRAGTPIHFDDDPATDERI